MHKLLFLLGFLISALGASSLDAVDHFSGSNIHVIKSKKKQKKKPQENMSDSTDYFKGKFPPNDHRAPTFRKCFELLEARNAKILVETGTARDGAKNCGGDGCSTVLFAEWARDHGAALYSVDICPKAIKESKRAVTSINPHVHFATQDSVGFLRDFHQRIDFLYLDSYDFDSNNPTPSQKHHLHEIQAALPYLHKDSVIMIDDCALPHGGKGKLVIEYLTSLGWQVLMASYQAILVYTPPT